MLSVCGEKQLVHSIAEVETFLPGRRVHAAAATLHSHGVAPVKAVAMETAFSGGGFFFFMGGSREPRVGRVREQ